jgi:hypothetical protein
MWHFDAGFLEADVAADSLEEAKSILKAAAAHLEEAPIYTWETSSSKASVTAMLPDAQIDDDRNWTGGI